MVTGIRESKIESYSENNEILNLLKRPRTIEPTKLQLERINLLNDFLLNYSVTKEYSHKNEISFTNSKDVGEYFRHLIGNKKDKEIFMCAFLDKNNQLIEVKKISEGTLAAAIVFPREIVKATLATGCKSVVFCHNHPSGSTEPSQEDINLTDNLINIITPLGVKVIDHVIVGENVTSLKDKGFIDYDKDVHFTINSNQEDYTAGKEYYKSHIEMLVDSLSGLTGIDQHKINGYINSISKELPSLYNNNILKVVEDPVQIKEHLKLTVSEYNKLSALKDFLKNHSLLNNVSEIDNKISGPEKMVDVFINKIKDTDKEGIYLMLFNSKLGLLGIEKVTRNIEEKIILNPRDILSKTLAYDAARVSLIHTNSPDNNKTIDLGRDIAQNIFNTLSPLQLGIIDYVFVDGNDFVSLKEKGAMPYTVLGMADYKRVNIGIDKDYFNEMEDEEEYEFEI